MTGLGQDYSGYSGYSGYSDYSHWSWWKRFWHQPIRAEGLALTRILFALAILSDQFIQHWPHFEVLYGPEGVAPAGLHDRYQLRNWRWTVLFFSTDSLPILYSVFWFRIVVTVAWLVSWRTRLMGILLWFTTLCFHYRNPLLCYGAEDTLSIGLLLLMISPCGAALSLDRLRYVKEQSVRRL